MKRHMNAVPSRNAAQAGEARPPVLAGERPARPPPVPQLLLPLAALATAPSSATDTPAPAPARPAAASCSGTAPGSPGCARTAPPAPAAAAHCRPPPGPPSQNAPTCYRLLCEAKSMRMTILRWSPHPPEPSVQAHAWLETTPSFRLMSRWTTLEFDIGPTLTSGRLRAIVLGVRCWWVFTLGAYALWDGSNKDSRGDQLCQK